MVGLGGLEPPTSPLSVVTKPSATDCDGLRSCWFSAPVQAIRTLAALLSTVTVLDLGGAQNRAQRKGAPTPKCNCGSWNRLRPILRMLTETTFRIRESGLFQCWHRQMLEDFSTVPTARFQCQTQNDTEEFCTSVRSGVAINLD